MSLHPFATDADTRFFFSFAALEQALSVLRRLVQGQESVTLVIGESGSGKTTFLNVYMKTADESWKRCKIKTRVVGSKAEKKPRKTGKRKQAFICSGTDVPVVIIDDAHQMTKAELKSLFRDAYNPRNGNRSKRLVLFGDPSINAKVTEIAESEGGQFSVNRIHLPRLSKEETSSYLAHRLSKAGYEGKPLFKSAAMRQIFNDSGGIPSEINRAAGNWLKTRYRIAAAPLHRRPFFPGIRPLWIIFGVLGLCIIIIVGIFSMRQTKHTRVAAIESGPEQVQVSTPKDPDINSRKKRKQVNQKPLPDGKSDKAGVRPAVGLKPNKSSRPLPAIASPNQHKRPPSTGQPVQREAWLLAQQSSGYTIQLIGVGSEQSLLEFIQRQDLPDRQPVAYYKTIYRGNRWYPLLYGVYPSARQARKAIENLPEPIREMNPWIRRLSVIQKAIRKHSGLASSR